MHKQENWGTGWCIARSHNDNFGACVFIVEPHTSYNSRRASELVQVTRAKWYLRPQILHVLFIGRALFRRSITVGCEMQPYLYNVQPTLYRRRMWYSGWKCWIHRILDRTHWSCILVCVQSHSIRMCTRTVFSLWPRNLHDLRLSLGWNHPYGR